MKILAIETSCDETALALVEADGSLKYPKFRVLKNLIASQILIHRPWGGIVPQLAKREHLKNLPKIFKQTFNGINFSSSLRAKFKIQMPKIDLIAVTVGPGLAPCLWTGINFAKEIHKKYFPHAKLIGVNHLEGHLYSFLLSRDSDSQFSSEEQLKIKKSLPLPAVALLVSGGHTILLLMESLTQYRKLGETRDDAAGEAFDKVGRLLKLPFPGGPEIEKAAMDEGAGTINFPRPMINTKNYDFSFSGLKTAVQYYLRDNRFYIVRDVAASFQQAVIDVLTVKTKKAVEHFGAKSVILAGGVAANKKLRQNLRKTCRHLKINFFCPSMAFNTDNAAMIAAAAYVNFLKKKKLALRAQPNLNF